MEIILKTLLCLAAFIASSTAFSQYTLIPDEEFEIKLVALGIDTEGVIDGQVLTDDIDHVISLELDNMAGPTITNLTGVEDFVALENLLFAGHLVENIDLSNNLNLKLLNCKSNNLISLDLTNNTLLEGLDAANCFPGTCNQENIFTSLDLSNNTNLATIFLNNSNTLTALDLSFNPMLSSIALSRNTVLSSLNMKNGNNTIITVFLAEDNSILTCIEVDDPVAANNASIPPYDAWNVDPGIIFSEDCALGIQDALQETIKVYPNPVDNELHIAPNNNLIKEIVIYDVSGKQVLWRNNNLDQIDTSHLQSGFYNLHIKTDKGIIIQKLIKK